MHDTTPQVKFWETVRFTTSTTLNGWEVVDKDGRSVTDSYSSSVKAQSIADGLNKAAQNGKRGLARALGCIEPDDDVVFGTLDGLLEADYA